ncbi:hypothetical protein [Dactylosporangium matsuzakiense]|uniref:Uncharacterized protein n=1 Tax=Dactylosporangium matsuzakiense TaxID=53360 RepID=A0A9W6KX26_9ACTN|nr:hypothetical protein [Dactylosporangium matsuzakiense]GLL08151.1 hypothetical protein GCM10017581_099110 [Dactylosporangium matsuzakiense]
MAPDINDPWKNLRRSGAFAAWFFTVFYAVPIAYGLNRNLSGHGDRTHLVWMIGVALALVAASFVGWWVWRARDRTTQWQLSAVAWVLLLGAVGSSRIVVGGS